MRAFGRPFDVTQGRLVLLALVLAIATGCGGALGKQYEYEEDVYLDLDGSVTVMVNASIPSLVALRGFTLDPDSRARVDRDQIRALYRSPVATVTRVSRPWRRDGRRFMQVRLTARDFRQLSTTPAFSWSEYRFERRGEQIVYDQVVTSAPNRPVGDVGWDGTEIVAFRLHLPARIQEHNTPTKKVERGNILVWEQPLRDRLAGTPVRMTVRMDNESILYRTLWIFGLAFAAAMAALGSLIWWVARGRQEAIEGIHP